MKTIPKSIRTREIVNKQTGEIELHPTNKLDRNSTYINRELDSLLIILESDPQIISKVQLFKAKPYSMFQFYNWKKRFESIPSIQTKLKKIEEILEANLITQGQSGKNFAFSIFMLKNNYGYQDKREIDTNNNYQFNVARGISTPVRKLIKSSTK